MSNLFSDDVPAETILRKYKNRIRFLDYFAGGGGASKAIELAIGHGPMVAINHDANAIKMHAANHPDTWHVRKDVFEADPTDISNGYDIDAAWFSPDCRHFSRAKGKVPVSKKIRGLAWVVIRTAAKLGDKKPKLIFLENVKEFQDWGPLKHLKGTKPTREEIKARAHLLPPADRRKFFVGYKYDANGGRVMMPDKKRKGHTFKRFVQQLRDLGYNDVQWRELNAADFGAPTHRRRLFLIARCDGNPVEWPEPTHGPGRKFPWRTAAQCINWDRPAPSIFLSKQDAAILRDKSGIRCKRPLERKTLFRIANGIKRYVIDNASPFIVRTGHWSNITGAGAGFRGQGTDTPLGTVCSTNDKGLIVPYLIAFYSSGSGLTGSAAGRPLPAITAKARFGLTIPYLVRANHGSEHFRGQSLQNPLYTLTGSKSGALVTPCMVEVNHAGEEHRTRSTEVPMPTLTGKHGHGVATAHLSQVGHWDDNRPGRPADEPHPPILAKARTELVSAHLSAVDAGVMMKICQNGSNGDRTKSPNEPLSTIVSKNEDCIAAAHLVKLRGSGGAKSATDPLDTVVAGAPTFGPVAAHMVKFRGDSSGTEANAPLPTITGGGDTARPAGAAHALGAAAATLVKMNHGDKQAFDVDEPLRTILGGANHHGSVAAALAEVQAGVDAATWQAFNHVWAFLCEHLGKDAPAPIVEVDGQTYLIVDIGLRMLVPSELLAAQFSPEIAADYILTGTDADKVRRIGNSVSPPVAAAIIRQNMGSYVKTRARNRRASKAA